MSRTFHWLDVQRIAEELADSHPDLDPLAVRFVALRALVEALPGFKAEPGHPVNERILEEVQRHWVEERQGQHDEEEQDG